MLGVFADSAPCGNGPVDLSSVVTAGRATT
jgi:hypothetical protein